MFGEKQYFYLDNSAAMPEGYSLTNFDVTLSLRDVCQYTTASLNSSLFRNGLEYIFLVNGDEQISENFKIKFISSIAGREVANYVPIQILHREITIETASQQKVNNGDALINTNYTVSGEGMAPGESIEVIVSGKCTAVGRVENKISGIYIIDAEGNKTYMAVSGVANGGVIEIGNYKIKLVYGTLEITKK